MTYLLIDSDEHSRITFVVLTVISFPLTLFSFTLLLLTVSEAQNRGTLRSLLILFLPQAFVSSVINCFCSELISLQFLFFQKQCISVSRPKPVNAKSQVVGHVWWVKSNTAEIYHQNKFSWKITLLSACVRHFKCHWVFSLFLSPACQISTFCHGPSCFIQMCKGPFCVRQRCTRV